VKKVLPTNNIRTPTAQCPVVYNLGKMPPATTAFVVGGFDCILLATMMHRRHDEHFGQVDFAGITRVAIFDFQT
jgi:hypothetical protein